MLLLISFVVVKIGNNPNACQSVSICLMLLEQNATDWEIITSKFIWYIILEAGKSKIQGLCLKELLCQKGGEKCHMVRNHRHTCVGMEQREAWTHCFNKNPPHNNYLFLR